MLSKEQQKHEIVTISSSSMLTLPERCNSGLRLLFSAGPCFQDWRVKVHLDELGTKRNLRRWMQNLPLPESKCLFFAFQPLFYSNDWCPLLLVLKNIYGNISLGHFSILIGKLHQVLMEGTQTFDPTNCIRKCLMFVVHLSSFYRD